MNAAVELLDVCLDWEDQDLQVQLSLSVEVGELLALVGPNRSGRGLLLRLCAGLISPSRGTVRVLGRELSQLSEEELVALRLRIGIVLQQPGLLSNMTVFDNVALPLRYHGAMPESAIQSLVTARLETLGLTPLRNRFPAQLNAGEARCTAIVRALIMDQELLLLEDPTEGLDAEMIQRLGQLFAECRRTRSLTILATMRTFSSLMETADRVAFMRGGRLEAVARHQDLLAMADAGMKQYLTAPGVPEQSL
jgi:phospholipid/cholesterol/gamma-HCH transport system ATP-binding protein